MARQFEPKSFWEELHDHPVTALIGICSIVLYIQSLRMGEARNEFLSHFAANIPSVWLDGQVYRLITTTLLHGSEIHIIFNLLFMWTFGRTLERQFGARSLIGMFLLFGVVSTCAELAALNIGIGLSGILFGYFGVFWVGRDYDQEMAWICHERVVQMVIFWFFFCIFLSLTGLLPIANFAHGAGLACGWLFGKAVYDKKQRRLWILALSGFSLLAVVASAWPIWAHFILSWLR